MSESDCNRPAQAALSLSSGAELRCRLVGADTADDTITLKLPPGLRPYGLVIGELLTVTSTNLPNKADMQPRNP